MRALVIYVAAVSLFGWAAQAAEPVGRASAPQTATVSIYDSGYALCSELRTFELVRGKSLVHVTDVPRQLLPMTVMLLSTGRSAAPDLLDCVWVADAETGGAGRPLLRCRLNAEAEGPAPLRLLYGVDGLSWRAQYVLLLREGQTAGSLSVRVALENRAGGAFKDARVRLVETERGGFLAEEKEREGGPTRAPAAGGLRYLYGESQPQMERAAASAALSRTFELANTVTLADGTTTYVTLREQADVPVARFHVYDGVRLDRFEKNPRNDWNYGTASQPLVDSYLEIRLMGGQGATAAFPRGRLMAVLLREDGTADVLGYGVVRSSGDGQTIRAQMGPARGLRGLRERISYTEVVPFKEYEESFSIRLENDSAEDAEVRVVEHLYRGAAYEIVKADAEYTNTGPQAIEFRPLVKAGGNRSINSTVRYRW
jgi:hypothetical protein